MSTRTRLHVPGDGQRRTAADRRSAPHPQRSAARSGRPRARLRVALRDRLSRFRSDSDLSALNHDPRARVPGSAAAPCGRKRRTVGGSAQRRPGRPDARAAHSSGPGTTTRSTVPTRLTPRGPAHAPPTTTGAARSRRPVAARSSSTIRPGPIMRPAGLSCSIPAAPARACARTPSRTAWAATAGYVVDCGGDIAVGGVGAQLDPTRSRSSIR